MLKQTDLLAQRGLGDAELLGCTRKVKLPAEGHKVL